MKKHIDHLKKGTKKCLVCNKMLTGQWTDYNGQIRCFTCGTTYQILGSHLKEEFLTKNGLKKSDIAQQYCDCFNLIPLLKDYWNKTGNKIPFGTYMGNPPIPRSEHDNFYDWLKDNADKYEEKYKNDFRWEKIKK